MFRKTVSDVIVIVRTFSRNWSETVLGTSIQIGFILLLLLHKVLRSERNHTTFHHMHIYICICTYSHILVLTLSLVHELKCFPIQCDPYSQQMIIKQQGRVMHIAK